MSPVPNNPLPDLDQTRSPARRVLRFSFSLGSMLVIMVVVAFLGMILSQLFQSVIDPTPAKVGYFALAASVAPSAILIVAGSVFKVMRWLKRKPAAPPSESGV